MKEEIIKEIIKKINKLSGRYSVYEIFADWVKMFAISISNSVDVLNFESREKEYMDIAKKYNSGELKIISDMCGMLVIAMEEEMTDILGYIYHHLELHSNNLGQFFTPYHLCRLMADVTEPVYNEKGYITVSEPSVGAGGNIIAFCEKLKKEGINYQKCVKVVGQDLDWKSVYMAYVQFSLYGIPAVVVQGDTLQNPYTGGFGKNVFVTPGYAVNPYILFDLKNGGTKKDMESEIDRLIREGQRIAEGKEIQNG